MNAINVFVEETDGVGSFGGYVLEIEKVIWYLRGFSYFIGSM